MILCVTIEMHWRQRSNPRGLRHAGAGLRARSFCLRDYGFTSCASGALRCSGDLALRVFGGLRPHRAAVVARASCLDLPQRGMGDRRRGGVASQTDTGASRLGPGCLTSGRVAGECVYGNDARTFSCDPRVDIVDQGASPVADDLVGVAVYERAGQSRSLKRLVLRWAAHMEVEATRL